ncbi:hypothetical protein NIES23_53380 [Trichormus variabilis NIES-23]|uniref:Uncharacterized protein n=1 Tax=Trichormus variabilis NIES-23 TaxID=1973479 RepID=A0A1Z4KUE6_ANAVA|nr:hypothetical protein NIES23_53380 [Trichormus variabilis NIES-23]
MAVNDSIILDTILEQKKSQIAKFLPDDDYFKMFTFEQILKKFDIIKATNFQTPIPPFSVYYKRLIFESFYKIKTSSLANFLHPDPGLFLYHNHVRIELNTVRIANFTFVLGMQNFGKFFEQNYIGKRMVLANLKEFLINLVYQ